VKVTRLQEHVNLQENRFGRSVVLTSDTAVMFLYSFKPGQAMTDHTHPFSTEFLTVIEGEALITVGTESVLAEPGTAVAVPPEAVHSIQNKSQEPLVVASFMSPKP